MFVCMYMYVYIYVYMYVCVHVFLKILLLFLVRPFYTFSKCCYSDQANMLYCNYNGSQLFHEGSLLICY